MTLSISSARDRRSERYGHLFEDASSGVPRSLFWNLSLPCAHMEEGECAVLCEWLQWPVGEPEWDRFDTCSEPNPSGHSTVQPTLRSGPTGCFGAKRTTGMGPTSDIHWPRIEGPKLPFVRAECGRAPPTEGKLDRRVLKRALQHGRRWWEARAPRRPGSRPARRR